MNAPEVVAGRLGWILLVGLLLGAIYDFLAPPRRRCPTLCDLLFAPFACYGWLYVGFAICEGDLRLGYSVTLVVGMVLWHMLPGRLFRPINEGFWAVIFQILRLFGKIFKKTGIFSKKLFASAKK